MSNHSAHPKVGNLVHGWTKLPFPGLAEIKGIVVDRRGPEVLVMTHAGELLWVKKIDLEVIQ